MTYEAAIINGPRGRFGIIRVTPGVGEPDWTDKQRADLRRCFEAKHGRLHLVFLSHIGGGFQLHSDEPIEDLNDCITEVDAASWESLHAS